MTPWENLFQRIGTLIKERNLSWTQWLLLLCLIEFLKESDERVRVLYSSWYSSAKYILTITCCWSAPSQSNVILFIGVSPSCEICGCQISCIFISSLGTGYQSICLLKLVKERVSNEASWKHVCSSEKIWRTKAVLNRNKIIMEELLILELLIKHLFYSACSSALRAPLVICQIIIDIQRTLVE